MIQGSCRDESRKRGAFLVAAQRMNSTPPEEHSYHFTAYRSVCKLGNDVLQVAPLRISDLFIGALAILYVKWYCYLE
jgi:hypothetical protein